MQLENITAAARESVDFHGPLRRGWSAAARPELVAIRKELNSVLEDAYADQLKAKYKAMRSAATKK